MRQFLLRTLVSAVLRLTVTVALIAPGINQALAQSVSEERGRDEETLDIPRSSDPGEQPFIRHFIADEIHMWTSPFRKGTYSDNGLRYVLPFTLISGALIATDNRTSNLLPNSEDQSKWSLRVSEIGAPYSLAGMAAGMYLISKATGNKKARETGFLGASAVLHSQIITQVLKVATQRERPVNFKRNHTSGLAFFKGGNSFPSGHASGSFALATIFASEYGRDHRWVPFVAYGLAGVVAASRMSAQKHWVSDLFVGGFLGGAVGRYIYRQHHIPGIGEEQQRSRFGQWKPAMTVVPGGVGLAWRF